ncbi:glycine cleavage system protein GcvH [Palleronia sediminis]|uniref:Glycine cleavage system H protein n=1 Tax=Palleronia sediminis TaxID=2547833 RepID=A0A4R6A1P9_9RHOB|nr:glycine cleavage system protein GcvH [Palleronia sediminis]TDL74926.1 glycine cleavage system protein GcvH [Palleronia sediminis]
MRFTEEHEWIRPEPDEEDIVTVGLTEYGAERLGDLVFVELPDEGLAVVREDEVVMVEGDRAETAILAPFDGEIIEVNPALEDNPGLVNDDPLGAGWLFRMQVEDMSAMDEFMDEAAYRKFAR